MLHDAAAGVDLPRRADPDAGERAGLHAGAFGSLAQGLGHRLRHIDRPARGRRGVPRLAADLVALVDHDRLDLGSAEVDAAAQTRHGQSIAEQSREGEADGPIRKLFAASYGDPTQGGHIDDKPKARASHKDSG
jgi:hypothetical protein